MYCETLNNYSVTYENNLMGFWLFKKLNLFLKDLFYCVITV